MSEAPEGGSDAAQESSGSPRETAMEVARNNNTSLNPKLLTLVHSLYFA